ncbi:hypothetical protein ACFE04_029437 [Oxalis oulophora]
MKKNKSNWSKKKECPCDDWKCFISYEEELEEEVEITSTTTQSSGKDDEGIMVTPHVGMIFKTDVEAFDYYVCFARKNGFAVKKARSRLSPQLGVIKRDFECYRSGYQSHKNKNPAVETHRERKSGRCRCDARMYMSKEPLPDGGSHCWMVVQFSNVHNHELLDNEQVRFLPAYRTINQADQDRILLLSKAGFPTHRIVKVLEEEKGSQGGHLSFMVRDVRNFLQNRKKSIQENDALLIEKRECDVIDLLAAIKSTKQTDQHFVYDYTVDESDKVENIAWSYAHSFHAYNMFGDVVYFDTTYHSNTFGMLLGAWFGIDSNGRIVFFGCVLLQDETTQSFSWALQSFIRFMKGRYPQTILTDLDPRLRDAVRVQLPNTKHISSVWSINSRVPSWFNLPLGSQFDAFKHHFDTLLHHFKSTEDFELKWNEMVSMFGLNSDRHVALLYSLRAYWAPPYVRGHFLMHMGSAAYSKSVDEFLKRIFSVQTSLRSFFEQQDGTGQSVLAKVLGCIFSKHFYFSETYFAVLKSLLKNIPILLQVGVIANMNNQAHQDMRLMRIKTSIPIEEHARKVLTPFAFNALQHELVLAMQCSASEMANGSYLVRHFKKLECERIVTWVPENEEIHCSCKEFETSGILCRHALRVLVVKNYFQIPEKYFISRWRRENCLVFNNGHGTPDNNDEWFQEFQCLTETLLKESSNTKERSDYIRAELKKEVTRLLDEVRHLPESDAVAMDITVSPS